MRAFTERFSDSDTSITLAFSGGGTRAAALSYGVLKELRESRIKDDRTLLQEVDTISAVSGGSFTAGYYGVYGDQIFETFEDDFLRKNLESLLFRGFINPFNWFSRRGRTDRAIRLYSEKIFGDAVFADLVKPNSPFIIINASDLGYGTRFAFIQEYFSLLCSDIDDFSVAKAVAASSAVPVLFTPVTLENYSGCENLSEPYLLAAREKGIKNQELEFTALSLGSYSDKDQKKYVHLADGGITDNLGLRTIIDMIEISGGARPLMEGLELTPGKRSVIISVDASTKPVRLAGENKRPPSFGKVLSAASGTQMHHYNVTSRALARAKQIEWAKSISTPEQPIKTYFIQLNIDGLKDEKLRKRLNEVSTSFNLDDKDIDDLILAGQELLNDHPEYIKRLRDLESNTSQ